MLSSSDTIKSKATLLIDAGLAWIQNTIKLFNPFLPSNIDDNLRHKAVTELALLGMLLNRQQAFCRDYRITRIFDFISEVYRHPFFLESMHRSNNAFVSNVYLTVTLRTVGLHYDPEYWRAIQVIIDRSNICGIERLPYRILELRHALDLGGFRHTIPAYSELVQQGILAQHMNLAYFTDDDAYSVTHTLFYISDFGKHPIDILSSEQLEHLRWVIKHLLGMYVRRRDWDITAELLLSSYCLGEPLSKLEEFGFRALANAQSADGGVPGPQYDYDCERNQEPEFVAEYRFTNCYHTTLVSILVGAMYLFCENGHG